MTTFTIGDKVAADRSVMGFPSAYSITGFMDEGVVTETLRDGLIRVRVTKHSNGSHIGFENPVEPKYFKKIEEEKVADKAVENDYVFKVGDKVVTKEGATLPTGYNITDERMELGEVKSVDGKKIVIKVLKHKSVESNPRWIGQDFPVEAKYFTLKEESAIEKLSVAVSCSESSPASSENVTVATEPAILAPKTKKVKLSSPKIKTEVKFGMTFITVEGRYTICVPLSTDAIGIAIKRDDDTGSPEMGQSLAMYRTLQKNEELRKADDHAYRTRHHGLSH